MVSDIDRHSVGGGIDLFAAIRISVGIHPRHRIDDWAADIGIADSPQLYRGRCGARGGAIAEPLPEAVARFIGRRGELDFE